MQDKGNSRIYSLYKHTSPSGKVYIGITNQPVTHRWNNGKGYMNVLKGPFKSTILKYGWDSIRHEVLFAELDEEKAKALETILIQHYKRIGLSLNVTDGGDGCYGIIPWNKGIKVPYEKSNKRKGCRLTEEHKKKLSEAHKGKHIKGHKWTLEQRAKLATINIGRHHSEKAKKKIKENSAFARKVVEVNAYGNIINTFCSASEAARKYQLDPSWIAKACRRKTVCSDHIFMYQDDMVDISKILSARYRRGTPITIRNIITDEIKEFDSIIACAKFLGYKSANGLKKCIAKNKIIKDKWIYAA